VTRFVLLVVVTILSPLSGCLGAEESTVISGQSLVENKDVIHQAGQLVIEAGALYEVVGGTLRLAPQPDIIINGLIEVRGRLVLRDTILANVLRVNVYPGASIYFDNVSVEAGAAAPKFVMGGDAAFLRSRLHVHQMIFGGTATLEGNTITSDTLLPALHWKAGSGRLLDNVITATGHAVVVEDAELEARGNTIVAGSQDTTTGIAAVRSLALLVDNDITAAVAIAYEQSQGEATGNRLHDTPQAGMSIRQPRGAITLAENSIERVGRAGIYVQGGTPSTRLEGNRITEVGREARATDLANASAGIALDGGAPQVRGNTITRAYIGVAILAGSPAITANDVVESSYFAMLRATEAATLPIDVSDNYWGGPTGPTPATPDASLPAAPTGTARVGPGLRYMPWATASMAP